MNGKEWTRQTRPKSEYNADCNTEDHPQIRYQSIMCDVIKQPDVSEQQDPPRSAYNRPQTINIIESGKMGHWRLIEPSRWTRVSTRNRHILIRRFTRRSIETINIPTPRLNRSSRHRRPEPVLPGLWCGARRASGRGLKLERRQGFGGRSSSSILGGIVVEVAFLGVGVLVVVVGYVRRGRCSRYVGRLGVVVVDDARGVGG